MADSATVGKFLGSAGQLFHTFQIRQIFILELEKHKNAQCVQNSVLLFVASSVLYLPLAQNYAKFEDLATSKEKSSGHFKR